MWIVSFVPALIEQISFVPRKRVLLMSCDCVWQRRTGGDVYDEEGQAVYGHCCSCTKIYGTSSRDIPEKHFGVFASQWGKDISDATMSTNCDGVLTWFDALR